MKLWKIGTLVALLTLPVMAQVPWDQTFKPDIEAPEDFQGLDLNAMLHIKGIYLTPDSWGLIVNITDCQLLSNIEQCPF